MAPTTVADCAVPLEEVLFTLADGNWIPFTVVGTQVFNNDCLTRFYLNTLSATASCLSNDNVCMIDSALELLDAIEDVATDDPSISELLVARRLADWNL
jgi:hypothetical protein